ncbi:MAG: hypothetical protein ACM31O_03815 [Bacteroidota bacterium]
MRPPKSVAAKRRRVRRNQKHVIYRLICVATGDTYIGITAARGRKPLAAAWSRFYAHRSDALRYRAEYPLFKCIQRHSDWDVEVLETARTKTVAHVRERELCLTLMPTLNWSLQPRRKAA